MQHIDLMKYLKKLDVYIIKKYLSTFLFTIVMITMIAMSIDFFEKVDRFLGADTTAFKIAKDYHLNFIPWINGLLWPLFALLAVIFFTSRMARESEIISILAAGVSYNRLLRPYLITGTFLAALLWLGNNYLIPNSTRIKNSFETLYLKKNTKQALSDNQHFYISPMEKAYFRLYSDLDSTAYDFRVETIINGSLIYMLKAEKLVYTGDSNSWKIIDYETRKIDGDKEELSVFTGKEILRNYPFLPEDFIRYAKQMEMMTTTELNKFINREEQKGVMVAKKYYIEKYRRSSDPITIIILTIIGASVASRKVRGGLGFHLASGIIIGAIFVILSKFTTTFATNLSLHPLLGVWIPNILFSLVAFWLYKGAQK